jgi:CheY-like chemotaxis protein
LATVLVVDDNGIDRRLAGKCVEKEGLIAVYAENGREALAVIDRENPDVVLTDLQMPEMDGLQLVARMRDEHPGLPVVLMTAFGSEEIAVAALRAGAASYVPKRHLRKELGDAIRVVLDAVEAVQERDQVRQFLKRSEATFELAYDPAGPRALISYLQDSLTQLNFTDEIGVLQVSTALTEALANAVEHGSLELDSTLREESSEAYYNLGRERAQIAPYRDRRIFVTVKLTPTEATYIIRDEGPGFDPASLPDPTDPENALKTSGRGIMLIRMFMDDVRFSEKANEITMVKRRVEQA